MKTQGEAGGGGVKCDGTGDERQNGGDIQRERQTGGEVRERGSCRGSAR